MAGACSERRASATARTGRQANAEYTDAARATPGRATRSPGASSACPSRRSSTLGDVAGLDVVELGCGTAYVSAWLARRGARPVGVDVTPAQLATARRCQAEFGLEFPLVEASAEDVPLPSESFDLAVSEYGASIWCDPHLWIPEALPAAAARRPALVPPQQHALDPLRARRGRAARATTLLRPQRGHRAPGVARRDRRRVAAARTASCSASCGGRASTSSTSSSSTRPTTRATTRTTRRSRPSGRDKWPAEEIWVAAKPR